MLTQTRLKELLYYDPDTGLFTWKVKLNNNHDISSPVNSMNDGYVRIQIDGKKYRAHRLAWLYMYGVILKLIDHKNRITYDNRIDNLRIATCTENQYNTKIRSDNKSGVKGVTLHQKTGKWQASCRVNGKPNYLGLFSTIKEAELVVDDFRRTHHREFSNDGK